MSERDKRAGLLGTKLYYMAKDLAQSVSLDAMPKNSLIKLIDVDYYLDDLDSLMQTMRPIVMYTFAPTRPAGEGADCVFWTNSDSSVTTVITGGSTYSHKLWDYEHDFVVSDGFWGSAVYSIEQIPSGEDENRKIVGMFPRRFVPGPLGWTLPGPRFSRVSNVDKGFAVRRFIKTERKMTTEYISVSKTGLTRAATVPVALFNAISFKMRVGKEAPAASIQLVLTSYPNIEKDGGKTRPYLASTIDPTVDTPILVEFIESGACKVQRVATASLPDYNYRAVHANTSMLDNPKPSMRSLLDELPGSKPIFQGGVSPMMCRDNDLSCISGRIEALHNRTVLPPEHRYYGLARWFITRLLGQRRNSYVRYDIDEVYARQRRPTQRSILNRVKHFLGIRDSKCVVSAFQKKEAYGKVTWPRNISTLSGDVKAEYSAYIYALAEAFYEQPWYAFSKNPLEITQRVVDVVHGHKSVVPTDYTKFDGTHSEFLVQVELELLLAAFPPEDHLRVKALFLSQYNTVGYTNNDVCYRTVWGRLSGSPETSLFNTFDNALIGFIALAEIHGGTHPSENHLEMAWNGLGVYGGDDGLTCGVPCNKYVAVASTMGLKLKAERVSMGEPVPFLSRLFTECWVGGYGSITEPTRQLQKLHLTTAGPEVDIGQVCVRKAHGYLLTDPETPVLADWARAVVRITPTVVVDGLLYSYSQDVNWFAQYDRKQQFQAPTDAYETEQLVSKLLGCTGPELESTRTRFRDAKSYVDLFNGMSFGQPPNVEINAIVGDELRLVGPLSATTIVDGRQRNPEADQRLVTVAANATAQSAANAAGLDGTTRSDAPPAANAPGGNGPRVRRRGNGRGVPVSGVQLGAGHPVVPIVPS
jgi:hypothetical protein